MPREAWTSAESRVEYSTQRVLDLLEERCVKATFFVLGWIAERHPGWYTVSFAMAMNWRAMDMTILRVHQFQPDQFLADVVRTKAILEDIGAVEVRGYRAPSYSIDGRNLWALDLLQGSRLRLQFEHLPDTPRPVWHAGSSRFAFRFRADGLLEIPVTTVSLASRNFPCGGGGYFRLLPYTLFRWALRRVNRRDGQPGIFYFHPWEVDPTQPRSPARRSSRDLGTTSTLTRCTRA